MHWKKDRINFKWTSLALQVTSWKNLISVTRFSRWHCWVLTTVLAYWSTRCLGSRVIFCHANKTPIKLYGTRIYWVLWLLDLYMIIWRLTTLLCLPLFFISTGVQSKTRNPSKMQITWYGPNTEGRGPYFLIEWWLFHPINSIAKYIAPVAKTKWKKP